MQQQFIDLAQQIISLAHRHAWALIAVLVIGALATAAKRPEFFGGPLARVPVKHRGKVVLALGVVSGVLNAVFVAGTPWFDAVIGGLFSAGTAVFGHAVLGGVDPKPGAPAPPVDAAPAGVVDLPVPSVAPPDLTPRTDVRWPPQAELDFNDPGKS